MPQVVICYAMCRRRDGLATLECGSSLAESEYYDDPHDPGFQASPIGSLNALKPSATTQDRGSLPGTTTSRIESLREFISSHVLQDSDPITTFPSPFVVPSRDVLDAAERRRKKYGLPPVILSSETSKDSKDTDSASILRVPLVYCDQTASNRVVTSIEQCLQQTALPVYGNTHTNTSQTGSQTTALVAESRQIIAECCNAKITGKAATDVVLFT
jgi:hypothetical protein